MGGANQWWNKQKHPILWLTMIFFVLCCIKAVTRQADVGHRRVAAGLLFALHSTALALVWPLWVAFWPIEHVDSVMEHSSETDHSDWLFSLEGKLKWQKQAIATVFYGFYHSHSHRCSFSGYPFEIRMQRITFTCWYGELFPIMQALKV